MPSDIDFFVEGKKLLYKKIKNRTNKKKTRTSKAKKLGIKPPKMPRAILEKETKKRLRREKIQRNWRGTKAVAGVFGRLGMNTLKTIGKMESNRRRNTGELRRGRKRRVDDFWGPPGF